MKSSVKKILSLALALVLLAGMFPQLTTSAQAAGAPEFTDVPSDAWYHSVVQFVAQRGLMTGTGSGAFSPNKLVSRATIAEILYRYAGSPPCEWDSRFSDVPEDRWYSKSVIWAAQNGIVMGLPDGRFAPDDVATREQVMTLIARFARQQGRDSDLSAGRLNRFSDSADVSAFALEAMNWAAGVGILNGSQGPMNTQLLRPTSSASRAELAAILCRFCQWMDGTLVPAPVETQQADRVGWNYRDGGWYYKASQTAYAKGTQTIGGYSYTFDQNGRMTAINETDVKRLINAQPLRPCATGVPVVDAKVQEILSAVCRPDASNDDNLTAVYNYILQNFARPEGAIGILDYSDVMGGRQFKYSLDLYTVSFAYDGMQAKSGNCRHFSAAFRVLATALGFETYTVGNQINQSEHYWNNIRLGDKLYVFDTRVRGAFCLTDAQADRYGYICRYREEDLSNQGWFEEAEPFTIRITFTGTYAGTQVNLHTWGTEVDLDTVDSAVDWCNLSWYEGMSQIIRLDPGPCTMTLEVLSSQSGRAEVKIWDDPVQTLAEGSSLRVPMDTETYGVSGAWVYVTIEDPDTGRDITLRIYAPV